MAENVSFKSKQEDKEYIFDPNQPDLSTSIPNVSECRSYNGVKWFPPAFSHKDQKTGILFIQPYVLPEEATSVHVTQLGMEMPRKAGLGRGPLAQILTDATNRWPSLDADRNAYISMVPWLLPKNRRFKPKKEEIKFCKDWLIQQVDQINPDLIVCLGKTPFDIVTNTKIKKSDMQGAWFSTEKGTPVYLSENANLLISQPWKLENLKDDLKEVDRFARSGFERNGDRNFSYEVIDTFDDLERIVKYWEDNKYTEFSVDCEWGGTNHIDGLLRSVQLAWTGRDAVFLRFFDAEGNLYLGEDYQRAGRILGRYLNLPGIGYMAHHFTADSPWLEKFLNLDMRDRCVFDTEYALQTVDEYAPLGLDKLALKYTSFGRYDIDLVMWRKGTKMSEEDGYSKVPDDILIPYAVIDTLVVWQSREYLQRRLKADQLEHYYYNILLPFVGDTFHVWVTHGLPVNRERFESVRKFMNWAYQVLLNDFCKAVRDQADQKLAEKFEFIGKFPIWDKFDDVDPHLFLNRLFALNSEEPIDWEDPIVDHWASCKKDFNIRSQPQMRRWLFDVMGFEPVKSSDGKLWEKVKELPPKVRAELHPSVDKETLEILADQDDTGLIHRLLAVSNVGNQCKGFLKEGLVGPDGETVKENGLAKFIASDGRIHGQYSVTETGRPRSWKPNVLNLSSHHNKGAEKGLVRVLDERPDLEIPEECITALGSREQIEKEILESGKDRKSALRDLVKKRIPSVRSIVAADPGWCFIESDYKTAEIRGQAFIFGDSSLIRLMTETDPSFGLVMKNGEEVPVRLYYDSASGIDEDQKNPEFIKAIVDESGNVEKFKDEHLLLTETGEIKHPPYDLHWSVVELTYAKPREILSNKKDRGSGKIANFSCLPGWTKILTHKGEKDLSSLSILDRVWDGVEWVRHEGLECRGLRLCIEYDGIVATPDHLVFVEGQDNEFEFGRVGGIGDKIWTGGVEGKSQEDIDLWVNPDLISVKNRNRWSVLLGDYCARSKEEGFGGKQDLLRLERAGFRPRLEWVYDVIDAGPRNRFSVVSEIDKEEDLVVENALYERERKSKRQSGREKRIGNDQSKRNQSKRNQSRKGFEFEKTSEERIEFLEKEIFRRRLGEENFASRFSPRDGDRGGNEKTVAYRGASGVRSSSNEEVSRARLYRCPDPRTVEETGSESSSIPKSLVLVHNCAYGAIGSTLERRIEVATGVKPAEGTGDLLLDTLAKRQPKVFQGLEDVAEVPREGGTLRAASGRLRRFPYHPDNINGISWRTKRNLQRAMGNEARNFFPQESVASTMARACKWANDFYRKHSMQARTMIGLYDSVVTHAPLEERFIGLKVHDVVMDKINFWKYHGRWMTYPIDSELNYFWSWKPTAEQKKLLDDPSWNVMDSDRARYLDQRLDQIVETAQGSRFGLKENLNKA